MDWEYIFKKGAEFFVIAIVPIGSYFATQYFITIKNSFSWKWHTVHQFKTLGIIIAALFFLGALSTPSDNTYLLTIKHHTEDIIVWFLILYAPSLFATINTTEKYRKKTIKEIEELRLRRKISDENNNQNDY